MVQHWRPWEAQIPRVGVPYRLLLAERLASRRKHDGRSRSRAANLSAQCQRRRGGRSRRLNGHVGQHGRRRRSKQPSPQAVVISDTNGPPKKISRGGLQCSWGKIRRHGARSRPRSLRLAASFVICSVEATARIHCTSCVLQVIRAVIS